MHSEKLLHTFVSPGIVSKTNIISGTIFIILLHYFATYCTPNFLLSVLPGWKLILSNPYILAIATSIKKRFSDFSLTSSLAEHTLTKYGACGKKFSLPNPASLQAI